MAHDASKRDEDTHRSIREFDLLLLGDIFELLRSNQWSNEKEDEYGFARPWCAPGDPALAKKVDQIVEGILHQNAKSIDILRRLADGTAILRQLSVGRLTSANLGTGGLRNDFQ
jgi:hypothetical protein